MSRFARFDAARRCLGLLQPSEQRAIYRVLWLGVAIQAGAVAAPYFSRLLIDRAYPNRDVPIAEALLVGSIAVGALSALLRHSQSFVGRLLHTRGHLTIAQRFYEHALALPYAYYTTLRPGELSSQFQTLRASLGALVTALQSIACNAGFLIVVPPVLVLLHPALAAIALAGLPLTLYWSYRHARSSYVGSAEYAARLTQVDGFQTESFIHIKSLKTMGRERYCADRFGQLGRGAAAVQERRHRDSMHYNAAIHLTRVTTAGACAWFGWHLVLTGQLSLGELVALIAYLEYLHIPLRDVIDAMTAAQEASVALDVVWACLDRNTEPIAALDGSRHTPRLDRRDRLSFDEVSYAYDPRYPLFERLSGDFEPGMTAIVGASGSGKTTLIQMAVGFTQPTAGAVRIGGADVRTLPVTTLRSHVTAVWQEEFLLAGTLRENLTLGRPIRDAALQQALEICGLEPVVRRLRAGLETVVGLKGVMLSAGQRQRVAIARALLCDAHVLLFDEATANLDVPTEAAILAAIRAAFSDRILVFVTHRSASALAADRVLLCEGHRLADVSDRLRRSVIGSAAIEPSDPLGLLLTPAGGSSTTRPSPAGAVLGAV